MLTSLNYTCRMAPLPSATQRRKGRAVLRESGQQALRRGDWRGGELLVKTDRSEWSIWSWCRKAPMGHQHWLGFSAKFLRSGNLCLGCSLGGGCLGQRSWLFSSDPLEDAAVSYIRGRGGKGAPPMCSPLKGLRTLGVGPAPSVQANRGKVCRSEFKLQLRLL